MNPLSVDVAALSRAVQGAVEELVPGSGIALLEAPRCDRRRGSRGRDAVEILHPN